MSRIQKTFKQLRKQGRAALIPFITAGDPSLKETERLVHTLEEAGADIIELGVPFSDPMADGPTIQAASERALKKGTSLSDILKLVSRVRRQSQIPLLLMGYYNPIYVMGIEQFAQKAYQAGVDAVLVVDLPPEESRPLKKALRPYKIDLVYLLAPTSEEGRIQRVSSVGSGFIYYVSLTGVTGAKLEGSSEIENQIQKIRQQTSLPLAVGFGISKPAQAKMIAKFADAVVVGSALVKLIAAHSKSSKTLHQKVYRYISSLKKAMSS